MEAVLVPVLIMTMDLIVMVCVCVCRHGFAFFVLMVGKLVVVEDGSLSVFCSSVVVVLFGFSIFENCEQYGTVAWLPCMGCLPRVWSVLGCMLSSVECTMETVQRNRSFHGWRDTFFSCWSALERSFHGSTNMNGSLRSEDQRRSESQPIDGRVGRGRGRIRGHGRILGRGRILVPNHTQAVSC